MKKLAKLLALLLIFAMSVTLCACGETKKDPAPNDNDNNEAVVTAPADEPQPANKYVDLSIGCYGEAVYVSSFDPGNIWSMGGGMGMKYLMYDLPFYCDSKGEYDTVIFESYDWTDDTHLTCKLRDNITFSNGDKMTGKDILYSLDLVQSSAMLSATYTVIDLESSTVSDDGLTIEFVFFHPYALWKRSLAFAIYPSEYIEANDGGKGIDWYDPSQIVSSGPYKCVEYVQDGYSVYERRDDYWGLQYGIDHAYGKITATNYSEQTTMAIDLENGVIDLALGVNVLDYQRLEGNDDDNIAVTTVPANNVYQVVFDVNSPRGVSDPKVREALCYAIDPEGIAAACGGAFAKAAKGMLSENEIGYAAGYDYKYDPDYARQCLEEAGYGEGKLKVKFVAFGFEPYTTIGEALQGYWNAIGVDVDLSFMEMGAYIAQSGTPGFTDCTLYGLSGNAERDPIMHTDDWYVNSPNPVMRRGQEYTDVLNEGADTTDESVRISAYEKLQKMWHDNFDGVGLYEDSIGIAYSTDTIAEVDMYTMNYLFDIVLK